MTVEYKRRDLGLCSTLYVLEPNPLCCRDSAETTRDQLFPCPASAPPLQAFAGEHVPDTHNYTRGQGKWTRGRHLSRPLLLAGRLEFPL